ncbi:MmcQ/YjbR family DNA-binding protein [Patescibacteria group bacterium]|nr:MAG: MmcQ/YjbR family DNA-binding protein [Patescibacteria group bacterium]
MTEREEIEEAIAVLPGVVLDYPFGDAVAVYKIGSTEGKMFALILEGAEPVRLSLKCDPTLAEILREKYETVLPGYHLNKRHWNTVICSGQVPDDELRDLIRHSYELVKNN